MQILPGVKVGGDFLLHLVVQQGTMLIRRLEELVLCAAEKDHLALEVLLDQPRLLLPAKLLELLQLGCLPMHVLLRDAKPTRSATRLSH